MTRTEELLLEAGLQVNIPLYKCKNCGEFVVDKTPSVTPINNVMKTHECSKSFPDLDYVEFGILEQVGYRIKNKKI